ncbi:hypothetical protein Tco_1061410 [Tanacetum coccineum]
MIRRNLKARGRESDSNIPDSSHQYRNYPSSMIAPLHKRLEKEECLEEKKTDSLLLMFLASIKKPNFLRAVDNYLGTKLMIASPQGLKTPHSRFKSRNTLCALDPESVKKTRILKRVQGELTIAKKVEARTLADKVRHKIKHDSDDEETKMLGNEGP